MTADDYIKRFGQMKLIRQPWLTHWKDIATYIVPRRSQWDIMGNEATMPEKKYYDYFPINCAQTCADGIQGYSVAASINWLKLMTERAEDYEVPGIADWLEECESTIYSYARRSNFYESIADIALDGPTIATATQYSEYDEMEDKFIWSCRHPREIFISENRFGMVECVYRDFAMTADNIIQTFGTASDIVTRDANEHPDNKYEILHVVQKRQDRDPEAFDAENKRFESVYIEYATKRILRVSGYDYFPYQVWRFRRNAGEIYGRSPGIDALPDILRLNNISKDQLDASHKAVDPPMNIPRVIQGQERLVAGGRNYYVSPTDVITPVHTVTNYPLSKGEIDNIRQSISKAFFNDFFLTLQNVDREMTAREVVERQGERGAVLSPIISRFNKDVLDPSVRFMFSTLYDNGKLPDPPEGFRGRVRVEFIGPLAQSQKKYHQYQGIFSGYQAIAPIMQVNPAILDNIDIDLLTREMMNATGMPQKIIREIPEVKRIRAQRAQAQEQAAQEEKAMQMDELMVKNANKLNNPIKPGSALEGITNQLAGQ